MEIESSKSNKKDVFFPRSSSLEKLINNFINKLAPKSDSNKNNNNKINKMKENSTKMRKIFEKL